ADITPYLITVAAILLASSLFSFFIINKRPIFPLLLLCVIANSSLLLTLTLSAKHFNIDSNKSFAMQIKSLLKPGDEIATYYKYYQDLPFYLKHQIIIVDDWHLPDIVKTDNWKRDFYYVLQMVKYQ